jgi:serine/threonine-protein kinase
MSDAPRRRLSAIMFADMVGYTALMQEDEAIARAGRDRFRSALEQAVEGHHGEILQHYGDGALSVFSSAVEAVSAAVAMQVELRGEPPVPVRIGVHSGDVVYDEDSVYGDGVNVASRIESLASPGGVLVSGKVYDEIKNHASLSVQHIGEVTLKNVKRPLKVFAISSEGLPVPSIEEVRSKAWGTAKAPTEVDRRAVAREGPTSGAEGGLARRVGQRSMMRWAFAYLAGAWAFLEAAGFAADAFQWPVVVSRMLVIAVMVGLPITLVITWYHGEKGPQRISKPELALLTVFLVIGGVVMAVLGPEGEGPAPGTRAALSPTGPAALPSIAVLPFTNQSGTPEAEPFAVGIHDDLLTQLSKIGGLKVISRTSVLGYRGTELPVPQIASELGVGAVLEGGVQRVGNRIRLNAQLIDAETDAHMWAETFDTIYTVENVFAIQSAIATAIADALQAVLTPTELAWIDDVPTEDMDAYRLYLSGIQHLTRPGWDVADLERAQRDFEGATETDPDFALAYAHLSAVHFLMLRVGYDTSLERVESIGDAARRALALEPDLPQGHHNLSQYLYLTGQVDRALAELAIAARGLPNDPWVPIAQGMIRQRQGAWSQSLLDIQRAVDLDPRNPELLFLLADTYVKLRRWQEAERALNRALALAPGLVEAELMKAMISIDREGSAQPMLDVFAALPPGSDPMGQGAFFLWWGRFLEGDFRGSIAALADVEPRSDGWQPHYPLAVLRGMSLQKLGQPEAARDLVLTSLALLEETVGQRPEDAQAHSGLGLALALLGRRDEAVHHGLRATELIPVSRDAYEGPVALTDLARIYAVLGEVELAIDQLEILLTIPGDISVVELGLDPIWDPLRSSPRFQELTGGRVAVSS